MTIEECMLFMIRNGLGSRSDFIGCTEAEVAKLEARYEVQLPAAYREFLILMGHKAGRLWVGRDCFYNRLMELDLPKAQPDQILGVPMKLELPGDAFIFSSLGFMFHFLRTSEGDDPPVYGVLELLPEFRRINEAFSSLLERSASDQLAIDKKR